MALRLRSNAPTIARDDEDDVLGRLRRMRGETEEETSSAVPQTEEKEETEERDPLDRLQAMRTPQPSTDRNAPTQGAAKAESTPQVSNSYREVDMENGRIRTRPADLSTPSLQDDPEEMAAELNHLSTTIENAGARLGALSDQRARANVTAQTYGNQVQAFETKLGMLNDTIANSNDPEERRRAQQEAQALDLYYQKAQRAAERYGARAAEVNAQFDGLLNQYDAALQSYQALAPKYTRRLGLGESHANRYQQEADRLIRQADTLSRGAATAEANAGAYGVGAETAGKVQADREAADRLTAQARDLLNKADREREFYSTYQYMQYMSKLNEFRQDPEFEAKSQADPALMQAELWSHGIGGIEKDWRYKDIDYAIINGSKDAYRASIDAESFNANDKAYLQNLTDEERAYYNYLYKTQGKAKADEFIKQITPQLNEIQRGKNQTWWQDYARNQWGAASVFSVLEKPMAIQTLAMQIADYADDGKIDTNAAYNKFAEIPTDIRAVAAEKYDAKGAAVYQQVMSMADNVYNRLITGGFGMSGGEAASGALKFLRGMTSPTIMLMMGEAAADSIIANKSLGMDDNRSLILGIGAGLIEGITENVSLEQLLNPGQLADGFVMTFAKNLLAEASEEGAADLLNWSIGSIYDMLSGMDESEYRQHIRQYVQEGMSTEEAARKAMQERYEELALDMLGGGLSGGLFGGSNYVFNSARYNAAMSATGRSVNTGNIQGMIDIGLQSADGSVAKNTALEIQDRIARGQKVSNAQIGRLALSVIQETVNTDAATVEAQEAGITEAPEAAAAPVEAANENTPPVPGAVQENGPPVPGAVQNAPQAEQTAENAPPVPGEVRNAAETAGTVQEAETASQTENRTGTAESPTGRARLEAAMASEGQAETTAAQAPGEENAEAAGEKVTQRTLANERQKTAEKAASLRDAGFTTAGEDATARIRSEESWDAEEKAVGQALRDLGYEPTFTVGLIENAEGKSVPYLLEGNKLAVRSDHRSRSVQEIAEKAVGQALNIDQGVRNQVMETITQARAEARAARQTTKTTAEKPTVSARAQATMESARAAGASEEDGALAGRLADIIGRDIRFFNEAGKDGAWKNGYTQNGVIYINAQAKKPVAWVVGHELTHNVEHSKIYDSLKKLAQKEMGINWGLRVQSRLDASARIAQKLGDDSVRLTDPADAEREIVADFFADRLLSDEAAIRRVCEYEPVTARNIRDYIKGLLLKLGGKETTLERALTLYNKALKDVAAKAQADAEGRMRLETAPETQQQESGLRLGGERQYSAEDEEYLAAVEAGDMETAQRMVDEAAKQAGYNRIGDYYVDNQIGLTEPEPTKRQMQAYELGQKYGDTDAGYRRLLMEDPDAYERIINNSTLERWYLAGTRGTMPEYRLAIRYGDVPEGSRSRNWGTGELERGTSVVDFLTSQTQNGQTIYDAIYGMQNTSKNIIGGWDFGIFGSDGEPLLVDAQPVVAFSDVAKIKSADPVTYDDNGKVIPLSERFNPENPDIRWSAEDSDDEYRQAPGTEALDKLGIRLAGSKGRYDLAEQLLERDKAAKELMKATKKAERKLKATKSEREFAAGIAAGIYEERDIPSSMNKDTVTTLADYYAAEESFKANMLAEVRGRINAEYQDEAEELLANVDQFKKLSMLMLNERTPDRSFRVMFGPTQGKAIFDWLIRPVQMNEAAKTRWHQEQLDKVRKFEDSKGKTRALTRAESELTMLVMEGKAAAAAVADMEKKGLDAKGIRNAAENIRNGEDAADAAWEFGLKDKERELARNYARWMDTQEKLKSADSTIIENAAETYSKIFDEFYDGINDFLVAHGYEPIGYIKGYAPHMQPEETQSLLEKAFDKMGISLGNDKAQGLPASIAGETAYFKPNKRWDPYFLHRTGTQAEYDIEKAYQSYVGYLSDILFHTDDIMRVRNMERMIRKTYASDEIKENLDWIQEIRNSPSEERLGMLRDAGKIGKTTILSGSEVNDKLDEWEEEEFNALKEDRQYNNLVMWLSNYANILAGKQSFADRGWEYSLGRNSLNFANRLQAAFQRSLVAGSLTSALNQTAQLPMIKAELGARWYYAALKDILTGQTRGFWKDSDFLTGKHGVDMLYTDNYDKFISALFKPSTAVDYIVSTTAVRGAFLKALHQGQSYSEAMRTADDFGRRVMGSREKGTRPLAYESKGLFSRMIHMFQVEAANSWDHIASDLPYEIKEIARTQGKPKAARTLAALLVKALLSTFLLNRLTEETYGGTPAPFDVIGLALNFVASGQGMTTNQYLKTIIDNGLEQIGSDRIFGTEDVDAEFDVGKGLEELGYNVMNDVPLLRNLAGVLGLGDQTVPLPGAGGEFADAFTAAGDLIKEGADGQTIENLIRAAAKLGAQFVPAGRQLTKTAEGIETVIRGGSYSKKGKLQYPVDSTEDQVRAVLFGKNATNAAQEHWASGENTLTDKQTEMVSTMRGWGLSGAEARQVIRDIGGFEADTDPETGKTISGSKKAKVVDYIDGLKLTSDQKDQLYMAQGYAESGLDETPWHAKGGSSGRGKTYSMADQTNLLASPSARMNEQDRELWDMESHGGNVNLRTRKTIPVTRENIDTVKDWGMDSEVGDYMTVASQTYRDGDRAVVVTPILPDGSLMTQTELDTYMDSLRGSGSYADADDRGIILGVFDEGNWQQNLKDSDAFAERIHELHEEREEKRKTTGLKLPSAPQARPTRSGLRLQSAPAAKPSTGGLKLR